MKRILLVITCLALFSLVACDAGLFDSNRPSALTSRSILQTEAGPEGAPASPGEAATAEAPLASEEPVEPEAVAPTATATDAPQASETSAASEVIQSKAGPSPQPSPTQASTPSSTEIPPATPTGVEQPSPTAPALDSLLAALAASLKLQPSQLKITELEPVTWPNLCFDFIRSNAAACPGAPAPGYQGLAVTSQALFGGPPLYAFRSSQDAQLVFAIPAAALAARQDLASQLNLDPEAIEIASVKAITWPDTCALRPTPHPKNAICLNVAMPGWQIELRVRSSLYQYATDLNGLELLRANRP
jgi:hypothetical protein